MVLRRVQPPTDEFVEQFQESLSPSALSNDDFIDFGRIDAAVEEYEAVFEALNALQSSSEEAFIDGLADYLTRTDRTRQALDCCFEVVGERGRKYVSAEGVWVFYDIQRAIDDGDRSEARRTAMALEEVGLRRLVDETESLSDHYRGMLVGMESHKRKNRQGDKFEALVEQTVEETAERLRGDGYDVVVEEEYRTAYDDGSGQSKTVDYALLEGSSLRVAVEANMYKTTGSKPSEVRRAYTRVRRRMENDGVAFSWITDGYAWQSGLESVLRQSYEDIVDIYNLEMMEREWGDDVVSHWTS